MIRSWFSEEQYERSTPFTKMVVRMLGLLLVFVALLGPFWLTDEREVPRVGRDIFFLIDLSASMNAGDIKPTRLEKVHRELRRLLPKLEGDRVGIIAFTDVGYVQCPLTEDLSAASTYLELLSTDQFAQQGTQFRAALSVALDRFQSQAESHPDRRARVIVLFSDGEDHGDTYASLIQRLHQIGVAVFAVGVGTPEGAPLPIDPANPQSGYLRGEDGKMVISHLEESSMRELASEFGTMYVRIADDRQHLEELEEQLYSMSSSPLERNMQAVAGNQFQVPLFFAIVLLLGSMFMMPIRKE
ncbi:MAG: VWA domain-containing protein [Bacteroidia bacterium]|nr:VWA domain-containing protein [Bacteroidia bacterium]